MLESVCGEQLLSTNRLEFCVLCLVESDKLIQCVADFTNLLHSNSLPPNRSRFHFLRNWIPIWSQFIIVFIDVDGKEVYA